MKIRIDDIEYSFVRVIQHEIFPYKYYFVFTDEQTGTDDLVDKVFHYSGSNFLIEKASNNSLLVRLYLG